MAYNTLVGLTKFVVDFALDNLFVFNLSTSIFSYEDPNIRDLLVSHNTGGVRIVSHVLVGDCCMVYTSK